MRSEADAVVQNVLSALWKGIASGSPLRAELETATCMGIPLVVGKPEPGEPEEFKPEPFIRNVLVGGAVRRETPDGAALLRVLVSLGTAETKKAARSGLSDLADSGVYPPDWVNEIGKVTPGQALRRYDIFGDDETIAVTFSYGETEHAIAVQADLTGVPVAVSIGVTSNPADMIEAMTRDDDPFSKHEQIGLTEAHRRLAGPLDRCGSDPDRDLSAATIAFLPVARSRVRRLPAGDAQAATVFTAADRAAAVEEFMKSPLAAEAVAADEESTRFWAEVLTGYSSRLPGEPPAQVGPRKLVHILLGHVPNTFVLSPAQRDHLEPAVTAWSRWSAAYRDLTQEQTAHLTERLPDILRVFFGAYDAPDAVLVRGYASGLAASDADISWLSGHLARRLFALPMPGHDHGEVNVADPADRRDLVTAEFGTCGPPAGMTSEQFTAAAARVVEELWHDDPDATYAAAQRMAAAGVSRHDVIHRLAGSPVPTVGTSMIR